MIRRILLADIDVFDSGHHSPAIRYSHHPVGLMYLAAAAKRQFPDIECRIFHTVTQADPLQCLITEIQDFKPDLIGLRSLSVAADEFTAIATAIRSNWPAIPLIGGGPYPSASWRDILQSGLLDLVVIGEGEDTFCELIAAMQAGTALPDTLSGTASMHKGEPRLNPPRALIRDVDSIPFPDYSLIDLKKYEGIKNHALQESSKSAFILSSRGCPYHCFYCHQLFGTAIRRRSATEVLSEMQQHLELRGIRDFVFLDDIFNVPMNAAKELLRKISIEMPDVRLSFPNGLRADFLDEEMLDLFARAGTVEMALAVETVSPRLQKMIGKNLNLSKAEKAIHLATQRFITRLFFITGFPSETWDEAMQTIDFAASFEYAAQPMLSVLRLYQDSPLFHLLEPNEEQKWAIAEQEKKQLHLEMFEDVAFYGDFFSEDKVPLKSHHLKELLYTWMSRVLVNPQRLKKSHSVLEKHLNPSQILEFYSGVFNKPAFSQNDLDRLLRF
jgi:radical SAM superfamily enzyme YgiQ (UPF0313 family)